MRRFRLSRKHKRFVMTMTLTAVIVGVTSLTMNLIKADVNNSWNVSLNASQPPATLVSSRKQDTRVVCEVIQARIDRGESVRLLSVADDGDRQYQMWDYIDPRNIPRISVTTTINSDQTCFGMPVTGYEYAGTPITETIPLDIARELILGAHEIGMAEAGGLAEYQQIMDRTFIFDGTNLFAGEGGVPQTPIVKIDSVNVWALTELGVSLPEGRYEIVNIDDAWKYE